MSEKPKDYISGYLKLQEACIKMGEAAIGLSSSLQGFINKIKKDEKL